jgi:hypothetical protein
VTDVDHEKLRVPDRFEALAAEDPGTLRSVVVAVDDSLAQVDTRFRDIKMADRGGLMILKGLSGAGKTTFANTIGLFRDGVTVLSIDGSQDLAEALQQLLASDGPRIVVVSGREALGEVSYPAVEQFLHAINTFVRSAAGRETLVIWPVNTQGLAETLGNIADELGAEALLGVGDKIHTFTGPASDKFTVIAERTIGALNEGASLVNLGITEERAEQLAEGTPTIGGYLAKIGAELANNVATLQGLLPAEQLHVWTVVVAGNDPEGAVNAVTRSQHAFIDMDRMMSSTNANIVAELRKSAESLGLLGTVLDARVIHLDVLTALAVARTYGDEKLKAMMESQGMSTDLDKKAVDRIKESTLGKMLSGGGLSTGKRGPKAGSNTNAAFEKLAQIASLDDGSLNRAIGRALVDAGIITSFDTEKPFGNKDRVYYSDLYVERNEADPIRLEFMWRKDTQTAAISNYVLKKLEAYGKAVGLIK